MKKTLLTALSLAIAPLALTACESYWWESKSPGTYKSSSMSKTSDGTKVKTEQETYVYRDPDGDKKAVTQTKTTRDPKGLFNKETVETTKSYN